VKSVNAKTPASKSATLGGVALIIVDYSTDVRSGARQPSRWATLSNILRMPSDRVYAAVQTEHPRLRTLRAQRDINSRRKIGDRVNINVGSIIMRNIPAGTATVVGANTVVNRDQPANVVIVGVPTRIIRHRTQPKAR